MRLAWTPEALQDRTDIWDYIALDSPSSAVKMDELFSKAATRLLDYPQFGRVGRIPGTREFIAHESYCLIYEIDQETIWILALVHTAKQWPPVGFSV